MSDVRPKWKPSSSARSSGAFPGSKRNSTYSSANWTGSGESSPSASAKHGSYNGSSSKYGKTSAKQKNVRRFLNRDSELRGDVNRIKVTPARSRCPLGPTSYDVVVIGSGFGSLFFMEGFMKKRPKARVLVLERG